MQVPPVKSPKPSTHLKLVKGARRSTGQKRKLPLWNPLLIIVVSLPFATEINSPLLSLDHFLIFCSFPIGAAKLTNFEIADYCHSTVTPAINSFLSTTSIPPSPATIFTPAANSPAVNSATHSYPADLTPAANSAADFILATTFPADLTPATTYRPDFLPAACYPADFISATTSPADFTVFTSAANLHPAASYSTDFIISPANFTRFAANLIPAASYTANLSPAISTASALFNSTASFPADLTPAASSPADTIANSTVYFTPTTANYPAGLISAASDPAISNPFLTTAGSPAKSSDLYSEIKYAVTCPGT